MKRSTRLLVRLLALALSPVLIVTMPAVAEAAPVYSEAATASFLAYDSTTTTGDVNCSVTGYWVVEDGDTQGRIHVQGYCSTDWQVSGANLNLTFNGAGCSLLFEAGQLDGSEHSSFEGNTGLAGCDIQDVCWGVDVTFHGNPFGTSTGSGCVAFELGAPPGSTPATECSAYTVGSPVVTEYAMPGWESDSYYWGVRVDVPITWKPDHPTDLRRVYIEPVYEHVAYYGAGVYQRGWPGGVNDFKEGALSGGVYSASDDWIREGTYGSRASVTVVGVQVITVMPGEIPGAGFNQAFGDDVGTTVVSECWFYFGEKVAFLAGTDIDEPAGPLSGGASGPPPASDTPPDVSPSPGSSCTFSWSDPTSWASGGICALVHLIGRALSVLGQILSAVLGLAADILGALGDLLLGLFVPSDGYLDAKVSDLQTQLEGTAPGEWLGSFTAQDFGGLSASGCGGIPVSWSIEGQSYSFTLLGACSGAMATAAGVVKLAASALLVVAGGLACLRGLGAGFGWSPSMGRRGADG